MNKLPNRFVSYKSKLNNKKYSEEILKHYKHIIPDSPKIDLERLFLIAAGHIFKSDYKHVLDPFGDKDRETNRNLPEKIRNWDFISPIINRLTGEFIKRRIEPIVFNINSDIDNIRAQKQLELVFQSLQQTFINNLIQSGEYVPDQVDENGQPIQEPIHPSMIKKEISNIPDILAIKGQKALNYIIADQKIHKILKDIWYDYVVTKLGCSYKDIINDEVVYKYINVLKLNYIDSDSIDYIEDSEAVKYTDYYTLDELYEKFQDYKEFKEIYEALKSNSQSGEYSDAIKEIGRNIDNLRQEETTFARDIDINKIKCEHIQYDDYRCVYRINTIDASGKAVFYDVDEDYIKSEDEVLEKKWVKQVFEGYVIADKYFINVEPLPHQRGKFSDPNHCKKSYNGVIYKKNHPEVRSIVSVLKDFQIVYNIVKLKLHSTINKHKGNVQIIPIDLLSFWLREDGEESVGKKRKSAIAEALYFVESTNMLFINGTDEQLARAANLMKSMENPIGNYLSELNAIAQSIKEEVQDMVGFNRFRQANLRSSDAVANVQQGADAASLITEELFADFNDFMEKEFQGLVDHAKYAYKNGKKALYRISDIEEELLSLDEGDLEGTEFGVFVKNGGRIKETQEQIKQVALSLIQNGVKGSTVLKAMKGDDNIERIIQRVEEAELELEERSNQIEQQKIQVQQEANDLQKEVLNTERYKIDTDNQTKIDLKLLELGVNAMQLGDELAFQETTELFKNEEAKRQANIQDKMNAIKVKLENAKLELKNKEIDSKERIAKTNENIARINPS